METENEETFFPEIDTVGPIAAAQLPFQLGPQHFHACRRGEILLTLEELKSLNEFLAKHDSGRRKWRFASGSPTAIGGAHASSVGYKAPQKGAGKVGFSSDTKRRQTGGKSSKTDDGIISVNTESKIKTEWGRSLHRLLQSLMQQEVAKPFLNGLVHKSQPLVTHTSQVKRNGPEPGLGLQHVTRHSTEAVRQKEIATQIQPYLEPTCLRTIISKLESGLYSTALEVFNDIYGFFLSGYRHYQPASPHWIRVHQLATTFFASASSYPLKDDFDGPPSLVVEDPGKPSVPPKPTRTAANSSVKKKKRTSESKKKATTAESGEPPVRNRERRSFQKMLAALPVASHLELYEKFKTTATWKEVEEGRVELDDAKTPPAVFREMMVFCASRVTRKRPLAVHDSSAVSTEAKRRRASVEDAGPKPETEDAEVSGGGEYDWVSSDNGEDSTSSSSSTSEGEDPEDTDNVGAIGSSAAN